MRVRKQEEQARAAPVAGVERLLRQAADFAPEDDAPEDLVGRVLEGRMRSRRSGAGWKWAASAACLLGCLVLLTEGPWRSQRPARPAPPARSAQVLSARPNGGATARSVAGVRREPERLAGTAPSAGPARRGRSRPPRIAARARPRWKAQLPRPPRAQWREEQVERYAAAVLTPVWVVATEPEECGILLVPGLVQTPVAEAQAVRTISYEPGEAARKSSFEEEP